MTLSAYWLLLAPLLPLLTAVMLMIMPARRPQAVRLIAWCTLPALALALLPWDYASAHLSGLLLGSLLELNESKRALLLLSALVWLAAGLHANTKFSTIDSPGFFICFLLAMAGNLGAIIAGGILGFYLGFALMSFAAYGLVIHERTATALRAGRIYIVFVLIGEVLLLTAMMLAASEATSYDFLSIRTAITDSPQRDLIILFTLMGLGIKVGLIGLHFTLPLIYQAAPSVATTVLAGAMINVGLLGWLQILPLGQIALLSWGTCLIVLGLLATFYGVLIGISQQNAKTLLAYSSISQMGILTIAIGIGLTAPHAWPQLLSVITLYAVHHGLAKAALFLSVDIIAKTPPQHSRYWPWLLTLGLLVPALALAGAPLTSGLVAKLFLKEQVELAPVLWSEILNWLLPLSTLATTLLMARLVYIVWPYKTNSQPTNPSTRDLLPWLLLLLAVLTVVWLLPHPKALTQGELFNWSATWPIVVAIVIAIIATQLKTGRARYLPEWPAGDLIVFIEAWTESCLRRLSELTLTTLPQWKTRLESRCLALLAKPKSYINRAFNHRVLDHWTVAMVLFLSLGLLLLLPLL